MTRQSQKIIANVKQDHFDEALNAYAIADAEEQKITAKLDAEITKLREKNTDQLNKLKEKKDQNFDIIQTYCQENEHLFETKKSIETIHGTLGFRTGTPKLKLRKGFKWEGVLDLVKTFYPVHVRTIQEIDKQGLLASRNQINFKPIGIEIAQDETFFIELKKEIN